jgi:polyhydroxyalkanoate synthase subunit PhaC
LTQNQLQELLDNDHARSLLEAAEERGYLEASEMRGTFDVLRANDLLWSYVASNWLMGEDPPAFDILAWNEDSTRMPARMHTFYLRACYLENRLARGQLELAGRRLYLDDIDQDTFIVGAVNDHIAPWKSSYKTTQLLAKADVRFVLSSSGHIAGIANPPNPKATHWTNPETPPDPDVWLDGSVEHSGSWWTTWATWIGERAGGLADPPPLGGPQHPPLEDAPGVYVRES